MGLVLWGVVLIVLGLAITFTSLLGFIPGLPLVAIGIALVAIGFVVWLLGLPFKAARALRR